jgi:hypothetical protein
MTYTPQLIAYFYHVGQKITVDYGFWSDLLVNGKKEEIQFLLNFVQKIELVEWVLKSKDQNTIDAVLDKFERYNISPLDAALNWEALVENLYANKRNNISHEDKKNIENRLRKIIESSNPPVDEKITYFYKLIDSIKSQRAAIEITPELSEQIYEALMMTTKDNELDYNLQADLIAKILSFYSRPSFSLVNMWLSSPIVESEKKFHIIEILSPLNENCREILLQALLDILRAPQSEDEILNAIIKKLTVSFAAVRLDSISEHKLLTLAELVCQDTLNARVHQPILDFILQHTPAIKLGESLMPLVLKKEEALVVINNLLAYVDNIYKQRKNVPVKTRDIVWYILANTKVKINDEIPLVAIIQQIRINYKKNESLRRKSEALQVLGNSFKIDPVSTVLAFPITGSIAIALAALNPVMTAVYDAVQENALLALLKNATKEDFIMILNLYTDKQAYVLAEAFVSLSVVNEEFVNALEEIQSTKDDFTQKLFAIVKDYYCDVNNSEKSTTGAADFIFYFFIHLVEKDLLIAREQYIALLQTRALRIKNQSRGAQVDKATNILYRKIYDALCQSFNNIPRELHVLYSSTKPDSDQVELHAVMNNDNLQDNISDNPFIELYLKIVAKLLMYTREDKRLDQIHLLEWYHKFLINYAIKPGTLDTSEQVSCVKDGIAKMQLQSSLIPSWITQKGDQSANEREQFIELCESCIKAELKMALDSVDWFYMRIHQGDASPIERSEITASESFGNSKTTSLKHVIDNVFQVLEKGPKHKVKPAGSR